MQIALKSLAIIIVVLVVLASIGFFVLTQTGKSGASASYDRIFFTKCEEIRQKGCGEGEQWNSVTKDNEFLSACRHLFGSHQGYYSCINVYCSSCKKYSEDQLSCASSCDDIRAVKILGSDVRSRCDLYNAGKCRAVPCDAC